MKCDFCGSNMELEQLYCPNCGKKNTHAARHQQDMQRYKHEFNVTKEEVIGNSRRFNTRTALITIICVLTALSACCFLASSYSYEIRQYITDRKIAADKEEHVKKITEMMSDRDYNGLYHYVRHNRLEYSDSMREYETVFLCTRCYHNLFLETVGLYEKDEPGKNDQDTISIIAGNIINLEEYTNEKYIRDVEKTESNLQFFQMTKEEATGLVKAYFGLTDEEAGGIYDMTKARLTVLLEDAYNERG